MSAPYDYIIDFQNVYVGATHKKTLTLSNIKGNFTLERNLLYIHQHVSQFSIRKCASKDKYGRSSGTFNSVEIMVKPTTFNQYIIDFFKIILEDGSFKTICCKATCMGSSVYVTTNFIKFIQKHPQMHGHDATFELCNSSNISVAYEFIHDCQSSAFKIQSGKCGVISPKGHAYVKVRFSADKVGHYYQILNCVLQYQEPIIIEVNGYRGWVWTADGPVVLPVGKRSLITTEIDCWETCMEGENPPHIFFNRVGQKFCSLSKHQLYFTPKSNVHVTELENLTSSCVALLWDRAKGSPPESVFSVKPTKEFLFPGQKLEIICQMIKRDDDYGNFYSNILCGRLFSITDSQPAHQEYGLDLLKGGSTDYPVTFTLSLVGHTFPGDFSWIPNVRVFPSNKIFVPIATPNKAVYNTFMIKMSGDYPVLFRFKPPKNTIFSLKPMQGVISTPNGFKIIIVKCCPTIANGIIEERWTMELNGNNSNDMDVFFNAAVETPNVVVEENNIVDYGPVYPGATKTKKIKITNNTGHSFNFDFKKDQYIWVEPHRGALQGCQSIYATMYLKADYDFPPSHTYTGYFFYVERLHLQSGIPYEALPSDYSFKEVLCDETKTVDFSIYNLGEIFLSFRLKYIKDEKSSPRIERRSLDEKKRLYSSKDMLNLCCSEEYHRRWTYESVLDVLSSKDRIHTRNLIVQNENRDDVINIEPKRGNLQPGESMNVVLTVTPYNRGYVQGCVVYEILTNEVSDEVVNNNDPVWPDSLPIFRLTYIGFYPTLQFIDIAENTCGPLFGFVKIWEMMKIDKLNKILVNIERNETYQHYIRIPDAECKINIKKDIVFIVENITDIATSWDVTQQKICDCGYKIIQTSLSHRSKVFDCPHKNLIKLAISNKVVFPHSIEFLSLTMNYDLEGSQTVSFQLTLSQNRHITLLFKMRGLSLKSDALSPYTWNYTYKMDDVYIGLKESFLQTYWFYNNTKLPYNYDLDDSRLDAINKKYGCIVIKCINSYGTVQPKSYGHLYFWFHPIDLKPLDIELPITYCNITKNIRLIAKGETTYHSPMDFIVGSTFGIKDYFHPGVMISLSVDTIAVGPLLTYTRSSAMFFLQNLHTEDIIAFSFKDVDLPGILTLTVTPNKGLLRPKEVVACVLRVKSFGRAVAMRNQLPLFYVNYTKLKNHMAAKEEFHKRGMEMQHEFMLGDKGKIEYPQQIPDDVIRTPPKIMTTTLSITVIITSVVDRDIKISLLEQQTQVSYREINMFRRCLYESLLPIPGNVEKPLNVARYNAPRRKGLEPQKQNLNPPTEKKCEACSLDRPEPYLDMPPETFMVIHTVMENLIHSSLYSKKFRDLLERSRKELPPLYYGHFKHYRHGTNRKEHVKNIIDPPPKWLLSYVIEQMIQEAVVSIFNMKKGKSCVTSTVDYDTSMYVPEETGISDQIPKGKRKEMLEENYNNAFLYTNMFLFLLDYL